MLTLALALALAQTPQHMLHRQPNLPRGAGYAFFEAFPLSGAGTTTACSTTAPTGAKGETLTFTRASNATCSKKGLATTGIADGDLVVLSNNVARVEPDSDGVLSFPREESRTNSTVRSQEPDNVAWVYVSNGAGTPTFQGADIATAPDGTQTADGFTFPATTSGQDSMRAAGTVAALNNVSAYSMFVRGQSGAGTLDVCRYGTATADCTACAYVSTSWTRCVHVRATASGENSNIAIGNSTRFNGGVNRAANAVYIWGAQAEAGAYATSYIPTTSAAAARQADSALSYTLATAIGTDFSLGATMSFIASAVTTATGLQLGSAAPALASLGRTSNTAAAFTINATSTTPAVSAMGTTAQRGTLNDASGARTATWQGASVAAPAASMTGTSTAISFGALNARTSRVCADPVAGRCTP